MSVNLDKHRDKLIAAWRDVLDENSDTDWALFGYEGQTNALKYVTKGNGGLEELTEDLNSGQVMYAFVKVTNPKTSLQKCILINWQGEGANTLRKGISANHLRDIEKFFQGVTLTIHARNEDEVEPELIFDKINKSASAYNFKNIKSESVEPTGPVGTTYQRVNPIKEINSQERDKFWRKEEEEEKRRVEEEHKRKEVERAKNEEDLKKRDLEGAQKRDAEMAVRNSNIDQMKQAEKDVENHRKNVPDVIEDVPKVNQSNLLSNQRKQEAQELIAQRTFDARSVFEQNTAAGQSMKKFPEKPVRNSILKAQQQAQLLAESKTNSEIPQPKIEEQSDDDSDQFSTIKRSPKDPEKKTAPVTSSTIEQVVEQQPMNNGPITQITEQQFVDECLYGFSTPGLQARALYDYQAADDTEITFDPGDVITNIDQVDEGWWQGLAPNGAYGLFPANYVELIQ